MNPISAINKIIATVKRDGVATFRDKILREIFAKKSVLVAISKYGGPRLSGVALRYLLKKYGMKDYSKPTVLCFGRRLFLKDIDQLIARTDFNYLIASNPSRLYSGWLPIEKFSQTTYVEFMTPEYQQAWEKSELMVEVFMKHVIKKYNVKAVMSSNVDYYQDEAFKRVCLKLDIPFLVLCKESVNTTASLSSSLERFQSTKFSFTGKAIAVFNDNTKEEFSQAKLVPPDDIWVTGPPRLDAWRDHPSPSDSQDRNTVVLISYALPLDYEAEENFAEVLNAFMAIANSHNHLNYVIKCKNAKDIAQVKQVGGDALSRSSIKVIEDIEMPKLMCTAKAVIGYNSLAVIECLLSDAKIIVPYWKETAKEVDTLYFHPSNEQHTSIMDFPTSPQEFTTSLETCITQQGTIDFAQQKQARIDLFNQFLSYDLNISCSKRVEQFIAHYIDTNHEA